MIKHLHLNPNFWTRDASLSNLWGSAKPQPPKEAGRELGEFLWSPTHQVHYYCYSLSFSTIVIIIIIIIIIVIIMLFKSFLCHFF